jgi:hypothetical protein
MRDEDPRSKYQDPTLKIQVLNGKEALTPKNMRMTEKQITTERKSIGIDFAESYSRLEALFKPDSIASSRIVSSTIGLAT